MNWASYPQAEKTSYTRLSHFLSTTKSKKIFNEWIWLGKILANGVQFAKFAKVFPRQNFALYGSLMILKKAMVGTLAIFVRELRSHSRNVILAKAGFLE